MKRTVKELEKLILEARKAYYSLDERISPIMSDSEYDQLEKELKNIDPNNNVFNNIGSDENFNRFKPVKHSLPMKSIDKVQNSKDFMKWWNNCIKRSSMITTPKIDGVSGDLFYDNGKLLVASTRGNGKIGFEIPAILKNKNIKKTISYKKPIHIRGEFYIPKYNKDKLNNVRSLRNSCSGLLKRIDIDGNINLVHFKAYAYYLDENNIIKPIDDFLIGIYEKRNIVPTYKHKLPNLVIDFFYNEYLEILRDKYEYETDGIVISFDDEIVRKVLNQQKKNEHHDLYNIAFKPPAKGISTKLLEIIFNIGRTGKLSPIGICQPVVIDGVINKRVSLYSMEYIKKHEIYVGDNIEVIRTNDILPKLLSNTHTKDSKPNDYSNGFLTCPYCKSNLKLNGAHAYCLNEKCPSRISKKFLYWFDKNNIYNFGEATINTLLAKGKYTTLAQLYELDDAGIEKMLKSINCDAQTDNMKHFINTFNKSRYQSEKSVIINYGIPFIGESSINKLKINKAEDLLMYKDKKYLKSDIFIIRKLCEWLNGVDAINLFNLIKVLKPTLTEETITDNMKTVVITGTFDVPRKDIEAKLKKNGYKIGKTVNKDTFFLLVGNDATTTNKYMKAKQLNIPIAFDF